MSQDEIQGNVFGDPFNGLSDDDYPCADGWTVKLRKNGEIQDTQDTDEETGCYTWDELPPS